MIAVYFLLFIIKKNTNYLLFNYIFINILNLYY